MNSFTQPTQATLPSSIMVLDDDTFLLDLTGEMLHGLGIDNVSLLTKATVALDALQDQHPEILLCDLQMPGMDGIEFLRQLTKLHYSGGIVIMSGENSSVVRAAEHLAQAHGLNLLGVLPKPFNTQTLAQALARNESHSPSQASHGPALEHLTADELRGGMADCLTLYYQPKVKIKGRHVPDVECLARWNHPTLGILPPSVFIEAAEKHGLIDELTLAVLRQAAFQLRIWMQNGSDIRLAVNVSMDNLRQLDLPEIFDRIVRSEGVEPSQFVLEITESRLMSNLTTTLDILTRLRLKGFDLAVDDFGTGYSTLENLSQLPFSELKLDRSYVAGASTDKTRRVILESSVRLGRALNLNMVAEGVETREEWELVCSLGCHEVQGYYVARPMPPEALPDWITQWENVPRECADADQDFLPETAPSDEKILIVDEDVHGRREMAQALGQHYQILTAESGEDALMIARTETPDLILLDVKMPGMDGYEICRQLKDGDNTAKIPVIFISAYDSVDDKLKGYEAGGEDYLPKPINPIEVIAKIRHVMRITADHKQLKDMVSYATSTAMTAMTSMGEVGTLLEVLRKFNTCADYITLADTLLEGLAQYSLNGVAQIRTTQSTLTRTERGVASPLEFSVINQLASMERIVQFNSKIAFNYEHVSMMVNNAPIDDPDRCGRLRDHLIMLVEAAEMRVRSISDGNELQRSEAIARAIARITQTLKEVDDSQRHSRIAMNSATADMTDKMETVLLSVGLTEAQDEQITLVMRNGVEQIVNTQATEAGLQNKLTSIINELKNL